MTTIKATCPECGEVGLTPEEVELRVDAADASSSYYAFICPTCLETVRKPADERVVRLLISGGVEAQPVHEPVRLRDRFSGPRISHDDLLDFHALLDGDDWFDQILASETAA